jgi:hypothetical protein
MGSSSRMKLGVMVAAATLLLTLALGSACGSDSGGPSEGIGQTSTPITPAEGVQLASPAGTPVRPEDLANVALEEVKGPFDSYVIQVPPQWTEEKVPVPGGFGMRYVLMARDTRVVEVTLECAVGGTVDQLMKLDAAVVRGLRGQYDPTTAVDVDVGGLKAKQVDFHIVLVTAVIEQRAVYLEADPCAWKVVFHAFGQGLRAQYEPLFDRILASFRPLQFELPTPSVPPSGSQPVPTPGG